MPTRGQRPLQVVFVDHVARMSGGEIAMLRLLPALSPDVVPHVVLGEDGPLVEALRDKGISVEVLPMTGRLRDTRRAEVSGLGPGLGRILDLVRYTWRLRALLRARRPDLVHTNSLKAALYGGVAGRLARVPVVWHIRDRIAPDYLPRPAVHLVRLLARILPTTVLANSASTLSTLPPLHRGQVLYNASVGTPVVPDIAPSTEEPRRPAAHDQGPFRVGMVGRLAEWKGQHVFLEAFGRAFPPGSTKREVEAWIIGSALFGEEKYQQRLLSLAEELGVADRLLWRGFRENVSDELDQLDLLVHCSITPEPFGQVVVEGMAAGLPVIASAAGGPVEIIEDGVDGLLTPVGDAVALAAAIRRVFDDPVFARSLGEHAQESVRRFSPEAAARKLIGIYDELTDRHPVRP